MQRESCEEPGLEARQHRWAEAAELWPLVPAADGYDQHEGQGMRAGERESDTSRAVPVSLHQCKAGQR